MGRIGYSQERIRTVDGVPAAGRGQRGADDFSKAGFYLARGLRWVLGGVFLYASYDKILHPQAFARAVFNYQILPDTMVNIVAIVLPWLEAVLGICLVAGWWLPGTTVLSTGLLAVFTGVLVYNEIRGLNVSCGCFSTSPADGPSGPLVLFRDAGFLAISVFLMCRAVGSGEKRAVVVSSEEENPHDQKR